jgi:predicted small secreted protein
MKIFKTIGVTAVLVLGLFTITACTTKGNVSEDEKDDSKKETIFKVEIQEDKHVKVFVQNAKKDSEVKATITVSEGDQLFDNYSFHGDKKLTVEFYKKGTKGSKKPVFTEEIVGEGSGITSDIPAGEYEVYFTAKDKTLTGTYEIESKKGQ